MSLDVSAPFVWGGGCTQPSGALQALPGEVQVGLQGAALPGGQALWGPPDPSVSPGDTLPS